MPVDTPVDRLFRKLKEQGKSEESAAKIAQSQTGLSLQTGEPPKSEEKKE